ncbi:hypothetical protein [Streptomyces deccanensis]|uniref:hypothetical protein n=1 Tax=Streptomyces deccanensis TaxID=424188 RepID=UPI001EFAB122|nr:hypothetical protein [Streptomyces deccanensis]ULR52358.1 hypothetical protein L3078_25460 [Streptomyces deccanensis]
MLTEVDWRKVGPEQTEAAQQTLILTSGFSELQLEYQTQQLANGEANQLRYADGVLLCVVTHRFPALPAPDLARRGAQPGGRMISAD